jgi:hypothetical protein
MLQSSLGLENKHLVGMMGYFKKPTVFWDETSDVK